MIHDRWHEREARRAVLPRLRQSYIVAHAHQFKGTEMAKMTKTQLIDAIADGTQTTTILDPFGQTVSVVSKDIVSGAVLQNDAIVQFVERLFDHGGLNGLYRGLSIFLVHALENFFIGKLLVRCESEE